MKILFTGHRGFLGREIIPILHLDFEIVTYDGDLNDFNRLFKFVSNRKIDRILHAAVRGGRRTKKDDEGVLRNNISITNNILRLEIPSIFFCSGAIYNRSLPICEAVESSSLDSFPNDFYGQSKYISTLLAKDADHVKTLRFFNVFGNSEGLDRFISYNTSQYISHRPMNVFHDFKMDFFYVRDALYPIIDWLGGISLPKELNLVYENKTFLTQVCDQINDLSDYKVPIQIKSEEFGNDYTGSGQLLRSLNYPLGGLELGIQEVFKHLKDN